jgi:hypothetical protein
MKVKLHELHSPGGEEFPTSPPFLGRRVFDLPAIGGLQEKEPG